MRYLLSIIFSVCLLSVLGQTTTSNDTLNWQESRPLKLDDFKGEPIEGIGLAGEAFCMNLANFKKPNAFQKTRFTVVAIFDRSKSWIDPEAESENLLSYFQIMFNIYEIHARYLRKDLAESKFGLDPSPLFQEKYNASMSSLMNQFNQYRRETKMGSDQKKVEEWKLKIDEELNSLSEYKR